MPSSTSTPLEFLFYLKGVVGHGDFMVVVEVEVFVVAITLVTIGNVIIVVVLITDCYCWVKYGTL